MRNSPAEVAEYIQLAVSLLFSSNEMTFVEIFGQRRGDFLWLKFVSEYRRDEGRFIAALDRSEMHDLARAVIIRKTRGISL